MKELKQKIYHHYLSALKDKIATLQRKLDDLQESLTQETKSTAGDKYETGRAMVHMEQDNTRRQHSDLLQQLSILESLDTAAVSDTVIPGSLVTTEQGFFFVSIAQGKAVIDGKTAYALSPQSPLGQQLIGCSAGDTIMLNGKSYTIGRIY